MSRATLGLSSTFQGGEHPAGTRLPFARSLSEGHEKCQPVSGYQLKNFSLC